MDFEEFHKQLADAPLNFQHKLRDYLRHPTKRNTCYIAGYIAALEDTRLFKTEDAPSYWLALINRVEGNGALGCDLIAEIDNPPAGGAQLQAEIEALRAEVDRDKALLRQTLEALKAENEKLSETLKGADHDRQG